MSDNLAAQRAPSAPAISAELVAYLEYMFSATCEWGPDTDLRDVHYHRGARQVVRHLIALRLSQQQGV